MKQPTFIVFAPHPDDETLGCGGTLARRIDAGWTPVIVLVTDGRALFSHQGIMEPSPEQVVQARYRETVNALQLLGCPETALVALDIPNGQLHQRQAEAGERIRLLLRRYQPAEIFVTSAWEHHEEHRITNAIVKAACEQERFTGTCLQYTVTMRAGIDPATIPADRLTVDISAYRERKRLAVNCFRYHLDRVSPHLAKPLVDSFDHYAQDDETFFLETTTIDTPHPDQKT